MADKGDLAFLDPRNYVGKIAGNRVRGRALGGAPLPASYVEHDHVAWSRLDSRFFLPRFQIGARNRRPGLDPVDALELRNIVKHGARDHAVAPGHDVIFLASGLRRDVIGHGVAVVHLAFEEKMAEG